MCLHNVLFASGLTMGKKVVLDTFITEVKAINVRAGSLCKSLYNYGTIITPECSEESVGHKSYEGMLAMLPFIPEEKRPDIRYLEAWNAVSRKNTNCKFLEYLKSVDYRGLRKYKWVTHVKLKLEKKTHSSELKIEFYTRSLRRGGSDGKWEEDFALEDW